MDDERDVEIFERIPWEALDEKPDRRWLAYLLAGVILFGALGISLGRQIREAPQPVVDDLPPVPTTVAPAVPSPSSTTASTTPESDTAWSEADLMALPAQSIETAAVATAEWYVADYFTRDEPGGDRSFVEWVRAASVDWQSPSQAHVTVLVRRLGARGEEPYRRLEAEAWTVVMELGDEGWSVVPGPVQEEPPELAMVTGEAETTPLVDWVDSAGLTWQVGPPARESS